VITVFGNSLPLPTELPFLANVWGSFLATVLAWVVIALAVYLAFTYVLRWLSRRISGEIDDVIIAILRKPLVALIIVFGTLNSFEVFELPKDTIAIIERIVNTALILILAYLVWRLVHDVVVYYGEALARKTKSRVDDVVVPLVNLFGPIVVILAAMGTILTIWGIDIGAVLAGAGIGALVLGFALQDTLGNMFSGIALLADAPFRTNDLIVLPDGKICQVTRISLRVTELYYLNEHSTIYVPNRDLANAMVVNITKPTVDLKVSIPVGVEYGSDLSDIRDTLENIARAHPNVLGEIEKKLPLLQKRIKSLADHKERERYATMENKLKEEQALDKRIADLVQALRAMARAVHEKESGGLDRRELKELCDAHLEPISSQVASTIEQMKAWVEIDDPWVTDDGERAIVRGRWEEANAHLHSKWEALKKASTLPSGEQEMRLDDMTNTFADWIASGYKSMPEPWKEPEVNFEKFAASCINLRLDFYVDDIRLEHFERQGRVVTEIAEEIHREIGAKMPFPQVEVRLKPKD